MKIIQTIKWSAAVLLLIAFFLPLSRCVVPKVAVERGAPKILTNDETVAESISPPSQSQQLEPKLRYNIPYKMFEADELSSWIVLLSFTWPFPILIYCLCGKRQRIISGLRLIEPIACLGSGYIVGSLSFFGEIMYGGYLAIASIISYLIASCVDAFMVIRQYIRRKKRTSG